MRQAIAPNINFSRCLEVRYKRAMLGGRYGDGMTAIELYFYLAGLILGFEAGVESSSSAQVQPPSSLWLAVDEKILLCEMANSSFPEEAEHNYFHAMKQLAGERNWEFLKKVSEMFFFHYVSQRVTA